jgi:hypothetical protein
LLSTARKIVDLRASLRHDLAGRIYHRLLTEAKSLGAFYTSIPAAVLLLKLALNPNEWANDWSNLDEIRGLRIADLACGTGTLLMAASDVVLDNYVRACVEEKKALDLNTLHHCLVKDVIYGFDVVDSAIHLTASTLALRNPDIPINITHLSSLPLGGETRQLGSLEFLENPKFLMGSLFTLPEKTMGNLSQKLSGAKSVRLPTLDLCVMNPPFTRSVGGNLLFGNFPENERQRMQLRLKQIVEREELSASVTVGLGSVFVALADRYLKDQGRIALVLPRSLLSGVEWGKTRQLISEYYHLEYVIVSHEPNHWNFSENTSLSEVMIIAQKRKNRHKSEDVNYINLWKQPSNAIEALSVARLLRENNPPPIKRGALDLTIGHQKIGEAFTYPWRLLSKQLWSYPCAFAQTDLTKALLLLMQGQLYIPTKGIVSTNLPMCALGTIGKLGFDRRDIHDGFSLSNSRTNYPAIWGNDTRSSTKILQEPNQFLNPLPQPKRGRPRREADRLWSKAGYVLIAESLRLNTMRLTTLLCTQKVVSNVWWPLTCDSMNAAKALVLWLNSTLGFLMLMGVRAETEGPWVHFKKTYS